MELHQKSIRAAAAAGHDLSNIIGGNKSTEAAAKDEFTDEDNGDVVDLAEGRCSCC